MTIKISMAMPLHQARQLLPDGSHQLTTVAGHLVPPTLVQVGGDSPHTRDLNGVRSIPL